MSSNGLLDVKTVKGTTDGDAFYDFVQTHLIPHIMPYNGTNPHSVVVLDNCAVHHIREVRKLLDVGAIVHFLPPYSPDMNPIEELFSKVKYKLRRFADDFDLERLLLLSFSAVTSDDCNGWINHCTIYNH